MLRHVSARVAEDQSFIAMDLALALEDAGGEVVAPAASCEEAVTFLSTGIVIAAIMDVDLVDGDCPDFVEVLGDFCVPFIIHTAVDLPPSLTTRISGLVVQIKPCPPAILVARLESLITGHEHIVVIAPASDYQGQAVA